MVLATVYRIVGEPLSDAVLQAALWTAISAVVWMLTWKKMRSTATRLKDGGQILSYLRYPDSRAGSLSSAWNMGIATPRIGRIDFQPAVYDTLEPSGRPTTLQVVDISTERRRISGKEKKYISGFGIQAVAVKTEKGSVEIAASPESLERLVRAVRSET